MPIAPQSFRSSARTGLLTACAFPHNRSMVLRRRFTGLQQNSAPCWLDGEYAGSRKRSKASSAEWSSGARYERSEPDRDPRCAEARCAGRRTRNTLGPRPGDLLTAEQEKLMIEHLPIVRFIARRIHERLPQHVPIEDLYSAGVVGLLDAFGKFDPSKQVQFRSYAQFRIRGAILDSLRTLDWSPRELRRKGRAIEQAIQTSDRPVWPRSQRHRNRPPTAHRSGSLSAVAGGTEGPWKSAPCIPSAQRTQAKKSWSTCRTGPRTIRFFATCTPRCGSG